MEGACKEISVQYPINFIEIGEDEDHVHFLIQSISKIAPAQIANIIKSVTAKRIFKNCPEVKRKLWGGNFWSDGYFVSTVGKNGNEKQIENYVKNQGKHYHKIYHEQISFFE